MKQSEDSDKEQKGTEYVLMDRWTRKNLEILVNNKDGSTENTLLASVDFTYTAGGRDALRKTLTGPPRSIDTIQFRQQAVEALLRDAELLKEVQEILQKTKDIGSAISKITKRNKPKDTTENKIRETIKTNQILRSAFLMEEKLQKTEDALITEIRTRIPSYEASQLVDIIEDTIECREGKVLDSHLCFSLKEEPDSLLSLARRVYNETIKEVLEYIDTVSRRHGVAIKTAFSKSSVHLSVEETQSKQVLANREFINTQRKKKRVFFTTVQLLKYNTRLKETATEIYLACENRIEATLEKVEEKIECLHAISEAFSLLDLLSSFCEYSKTRKTTVPRFSGEVVSVQNGYCPMLRQSADPNSFFIHAGNRFQLVSGKNMSGKSVYLKQLGLLTVMACSGMRVPCDTAVFRVFDRICLRSGSDDDSSGNASTFFVEMREMGAMLRDGTSNSLFLIDELGRGTATEDGVLLSVSICEEIVRRRTFSLFATHSGDIAARLSVYPSVCQLQMRGCYLAGNAAAETETEEYGLELAKTLGFPGEILSEAESISDQLLRKAPREKTRRESVDKERYEKAMLIKTILEESGQSEEAIGESLSDLCSEKTGRIEERFLLVNKTAECV
ncbi:MAG: mutS-like protein 4 [Amphiamblys sp. WSBS2006]|nr:MAG: mutS-like protein 4 [Amphiamblys sp. WSBS2006]